jgi:hypothetical protein
MRSLSQIDDVKKTTQIGLRIDDVLAERFARITNDYPAVNLSGLLREAIEAGLPVVEANYPPKKKPDADKRQAA